MSAEDIKKANTLIDDTVRNRIIALALTGASATKIARETGLPKYRVSKVLNAPAVRKQLLELTDEAVAIAKTTLKKQITGLTRDTYLALANQLRDNNSIEAVKVVLRILGFKDAEDVVKGDSSINIILPTTIKEGSLPDVEIQGHALGEGISDARSQEHGAESDPEST